MTDRAPTNLFGRGWHWFAQAPTPKRRAVSWVLAMTVVFFGFLSLQRANDSTAAANTRLTNVVNQQEADRAQRRVEAAARDFALCQRGNETVSGVIDAFGKFNSTLGALAGEGQSGATPEGRARLEKAIDQLQGAVVAALPNPSDCDVYLDKLTPEEKAKVQSTTVPPTIPRR